MYKQDQIESKKVSSNQTDIPISIKSELEKSSGISLDNVKVNYNSSLPQSVGALAITKGTNIDIAPNQEKHLKHELGHAIDYLSGGNQSPTLQYASVKIDDSQASEKRADDYANGKRAIIHKNTIVKPVVLRKVGLEFQTFKGRWNVRKLDVSKMRGKDITLPSGEKKSLNTDEEIITEFESNYLNYINRGYLVQMGTEEARDISFEQPEGYKVSADGEDLEYITNAFDDRSEQDKLIHAATKAGEMHKKIYEGSKDIPFNGVEKKVGSLYRLKADENYYINQLGEQTAHPQATVGVKYESIPDLFTAIATSNKSGKVNYLAETSVDRPVAMRSFQSISDLSTKTYTLSKKTQGFLQLVEHYITIIKLSYVNKRELNKIYSNLKSIYDFIKSILNTNFIIPQAKLTQVLMKEYLTILRNMKRMATFLGMDDLLKGDGDIERITSEVKVSIDQLPIRKRLGDSDYRTGFHKTVNDVVCKIDGAYTLLGMKVLVENRIRTNNIQIGIKEKKPETNANSIVILRARNTIYSKELQIIKDKIAFRNSEMERALEEVKDSEKKIESINGQIEEKKKQKLDILGDMPSCDPIKIRRTLKRYKENYSKIIEGSKITKELVDNFTSPIKTQYYFKTAMAFKIRTSLSDMFSLLSSEEQQYVITKLKADYDIKNTLIWDDKEKVVGIPNEITLETWIDTLENKHEDEIWHDIYNSKLPKPSDPDSEEKNPFGVKRSTDIGYGDDVDGAILELRQLKRDITPDKWGDVAKTVIELINKINNPTEE